MAESVEIKLREPNHVLQAWVSHLPWKMQSVLIAAQRAPDTHYAPAIKEVARWVRALCQYNADPSTGFMHAKETPTVPVLADELQYVTLHYGMHFMKALEIVAYKCPDRVIGEMAWTLYEGLCLEAFHLNPENEAQLDERLADRR